MVHIVVQFCYVCVCVCVLLKLAMYSVHTTLNGVVYSGVGVLITLMIV